MTKDELIDNMEKSRENFLELLEDLDDTAMEELLTQDQWSIKDILAHLARWEAELVKLLWQLRQGQRPTTVHFMGETVDEKNSRWKEEDRSRSLERILADFHGVRNQTIRRLEAFTDHELSDANRYPWLNGKALWEWVAADSYEHETEHIPMLQEIRTLLNTQSSQAAKHESENGQSRS
jgi:hypothetical protein